LKGFRDIEAEMYLGHGFDLSRSRDVIGHVVILSAVCGFLWVFHWNKISMTWNNAYERYEHRRRTNRLLRSTL